jgi:hypothetical protein
LILRKSVYALVRRPYENKKRSGWRAYVASKRKKKLRKRKGSAMKPHVCKGIKKKLRVRQSRSA